MTSGIAIARFGAAALLAGVSACATTAPPSQPAPRAAPAAPLPAGDPLAPIAAGAALPLDQALALLGPADVRRDDGRGALLVWRYETCALTLGFTDGVLQHVEPGSRRVGAAPTLDQCLAEARARGARR